MTTTREKPDSPARGSDRSTGTKPRTPRRRKLADRSATTLVVCGGIGVIATIFGILLFIVSVVLPLAGSADIRLEHDHAVEGLDAVVVLTDEYRTLAVTLDESGRLQVTRLESGETVETRDVLPDAADGTPTRFRSLAVAPADGVLAGATVDGRVIAVPVAWRVSFDESNERSVAARFDDPITLELDPAGRPLRALAIGREEDGDGGGSTVAIAQLEDLELVVARATVEENPFSGEVEVSTDRRAVACDLELSSLVLAPGLAGLFATTVDGRVVSWTLAGGRPDDRLLSDTATGPATSVSVLAGGRSLAVGRETGEIEVWFRIRAGDDSIQLARARTFVGPRSPVVAIAPSPRNRSFLAVYGDGSARLFHSTSERELWAGKSPVGGSPALAYGPKGDGLCVATSGRLISMTVDNPHPEVSWKALFGKVWYEEYPEPAHVWQSGGGSAAAEPKLSLTPLLFGTLKGTLYSLILAIPLGVLGALYTSQFLSPGLQKYVKPAIEVMAALPTVILGFLAGLWLAPRMEEYFPALVLAVAVFPFALWSASKTWSAVPAALRARLPDGAEAFHCAVFLALGIALAMSLSSPFEQLAFGGDFRSWVHDTLGLRYDQRNAIVVGLAMGFAVIPIVFSISEEAFSSVPRNLISGSLALGATRWQTVSQIVLPSGSPGVFAAVMVGFGRAIGETMVVLMATGNTAILSWNAFDGFRTMSANIAVEIPEAPAGGTLYRTLFLSGLLLFAITFLVNTAAEVVRLRLRRRFGQH